MLSKRKINKIKVLSNKKNLRLDKFIEMALFGNNGYYLSKKPIGRKFDFVTSPEISQMFGEIILFLNNIKTVSFSVSIGITTK